MKYFLFGIAVITSLVIAARQLLRDADGENSYALMAQELNATDADTNWTKLPRRQEKQQHYNITSTVPSNNGDCHLKIGGIVELYAD